MPLAVIGALSDTRFGGSGTGRVNRPRPVELILPGTYRRLKVMGLARLRDQAVPPPGYEVLPPQLGPRQEVST
jgi:hypothetical protein